MFRIAKEFDFCYGHRVWSQKLNKEFSLDSCLACRHLHGHQGKIIISLESEQLTDGMVTDFKHLNWFKKWLDDTLDHKFIIHREDPLFETLLPHYPKYDSEKYHMERSLYDYDEFSECWTPKIFSQINGKQISQAQREMYEGYVIVPFVPTSENLSKWIHELVEKRMKQLGVVVKNVQFYETPKSQSNYFVIG